MNDNKKEIILLLGKDENQQFKEFFLPRMNLLTECDLNDLYFLLSTTDKNQILEFTQLKSKELEKQSIELEYIGIKSKKIIRECGEKRYRKEEDNNINILLNNL